MARSALKGVQMLRGIVNSERMYNDQVMTSTATTAAQSCVAISQGDGSSDRTGNSILVRSISIAGQVEINSSVTSNTRCCLLLVQDMQQVADTTPTSTDILRGPTDPLSLLNTNTSGRFKVIKRWNFFLTPVAGGRPVHQFRKYLKLYSHVRYNGSATTDIQKGGYYLIWVNSESVNRPTLNLVVRTGYHDN